MKTIALLSGFMLLAACSVRPVENVDAGRGGTTGHGGHAGSVGGGGGGAGGGGTVGSGGLVGGGGSVGSGGIVGAGGQAGIGGGGRGGLGGAAGSGGLGGRAGQGGAGGQTCAVLEMTYGKAVVLARMCNSILNVPQCTQLVTTALSCGCPTYVNDSTELERIKALWTEARCPPAKICPAIACPNPNKGVCVPIDSGDFCMNQP